MNLPPKLDRPGRQGAFVTITRAFVTIVGTAIGFRAIAGLPGLALGVGARTIADFFIKAFRLKMLFRFVKNLKQHPSACAFLRNRDVTIAPCALS